MEDSDQFCILHGKKQELKKHVATIHCSNKLSLLQRKISNVLLYNAYDKLLQQEEHVINVGDLCRMLNYKSNDYDLIKQSLKKLISIVIEWNMLDENTGMEDWTASSILASVRISGSECSYAYSPRMRELLHMPRMYGRINLHIQSRFKSSYGLALYENCVRYKGLPYTKWLTIEAFRQIMGIPENKYKVFCDLKKRVIDKAIDEVNSCSDLVVIAEIKRRGRKPTDIRFKMKERPKKQRIKLNNQITDKNFNKNLTAEVKFLLNKIQKEFNFSDKQIDKIAKDYSPEYILEKVMLVKSSTNFKNGKIDNIAAYLLGALRDDYQNATKSKDIVKKERVEQWKKDEFENIKEKKQEKLQKDYSEYVSSIIQSNFSLLSQKDKDGILSHFTNELSNQNQNFVIDMLKRGGIEHKIVSVFFSNFVKGKNEKYEHLLFGLQTFSDFVKENG